ncbi:hypothetical protein NP493_365g01000 [Ridgeia piscesae]|uniref:CRAL-TRIO domain-containing protein n=1 Tax=Ridgeia piscesae TaxID=27915 RepID=A0AAD9L363_RIDPI|nr:hypothetical protein NP493_365g01000 [Ridgeia piscesae]
MSTNCIFIFLENLASGLYDTRDITRLQTDDAYAGCFIRHVMNDVSAAVSLTHTSLKWRKEMEINDLSETSFPRWVHDLSAMYYHNVDKEGRPVLIFHVARCKKDAEKHRLQKQYIAWIFEKHFLRHPDERVVVCFDMTGAGITNMDVELIKFQVTCFTTYYPSFLAYMLVFDMPWILNTIWRVIRTLLNEAQQKAVIFVKGDEIFSYIDRDQLLKTMGGTVGVATVYWGKGNESVVPK